jgi:hypothetical protein
VLARMERGAARWRLHGGAHAQGGEAPGARHQTRNIRGRGTRGEEPGARHQPAQLHGLGMRRAHARMHWL